MEYAEKFRTDFPHWFRLREEEIARNKAYRAENDWDIWQAKRRKWAESNRATGDKLK